MAQAVTLAPIPCLDSLCLTQMRVFNITNGAELFNGDMGEDVARCMSWSPTNTHLIAYCTQGGKV